MDSDIADYLAATCSLDFPCPDKTAHGTTGRTEVRPLLKSNPSIQEY